MSTGLDILKQNPCKSNPSCAQPSRRASTERCNSAIFIARYWQVYATIRPLCVLRTGKSARGSKSRSPSQGRKRKFTIRLLGNLACFHWVLLTNSNINLSLVCRDESKFVVPRWRNTQTKHWTRTSKAIKKFRWAKVLWKSLLDLNVTPRRAYILYLCREFCLAI